ncbi:MAG: hypothetical protein ACRC67_13240 [Inquilinus sp.]|uniref:hypothetical protein n=1 Tax=Inquilinus sp. TaxID=1932117 RepID=UPI003F2A1FE6
MRIHVVGSRPRGMTEEVFNDMKIACEQIGKSIGAHEYELSIGSLKQTTADLYIAKGFLAEYKTGVVVISMQKGDEETKNRIQELKSEFKEAKIVEIIVDGTTYSRHVAAMKGAASVLIIGGNKGSATAGFVAPVIQKPVLALPQFDGAGREVFEAQSIFYTRSTLTDDDIKRIDGEWTTESASFVVRCLRSFAEVNPFADHISKHQWILNIISIMCILSWITIFSCSDFIDEKVFFFSLVFLASIVGTCLRTLLKVHFDLSETFSARKTIGDFMIGIVVAFVFFLVFFIGGIIYEGDPKNIFEKDHVVRAGAFMSTVAIAVSLLLERSVGNLRERIGDFITPEKRT